MCYIFKLCFSVPHFLDSENATLNNCTIFSNAVNLPFLYGRLFLVHVLFLFFCVNLSACSRLSLCWQTYFFSIPIHKNITRRLKHHLPHSSKSRQTKISHDIKVPPTSFDWQVMAEVNALCFQTTYWFLQVINLQLPALQQQFSH